MQSAQGSDVSWFLSIPVGIAVDWALYGRPTQTIDLLWGTQHREIYHSSFLARMFATVPALTLIGVAVDYRSVFFLFWVGVFLFTASLIYAIHASYSQKKI